MYGGHCDPAEVPDPAEAFRLLVVCTGNVCRSPLAERLIQARLRTVLGAGAGRFVVGSAGTQALGGQPMDPRAAAAARSLGADPEGFRARLLTADLVAGADLVLAATREHRAAVVRLHPPAHRYVFTVREFARLVAAIPVGSRPAGGEPPARARELVGAARAGRGHARPERPEDDDIPDPHGGIDRIHRTVGAVVAAALAEPLAVICGTAPAGSTAAGGRPDSKAAASGPAQPRRARSGLVRSALGQSRLGQSRLGQSRLGQARLGQSRLGQSRAGQSRPGQSRLGQSRAGQSRPGQARLGQSRPGWSPLARFRLGQFRLGQFRLGQFRLGQFRLGQFRLARSRSGQSRLGQSRSGQSRLSRSRLARARLAHARWRAATLAGLLLVGAVVGWLTLRGLQAKRELAAARDDVSAMRSALLAGDPDRAREALADAQRRTARAHALTDDAVWRLGSSVPYLGDTAGAVRTMAATVDRVATEALPAVVEAGAALAPDRLRAAGDRIALAAFTRARPAIDTAAAEVAAARGHLDEISFGWLPRPVATAVDDVNAELAGTAATLEAVGRTARLAPAMLGAQHPRRYLIVFQNNAEARGTGGLPGLYGILVADRGRLRIERLGSNTDLKDADRLPVDLGPDYRARWGQDPALWANSNLDPSFPDAARIWLALWQRQTGEYLDGAVATDPVAVSYLLRATGPMRLPTGEQVTAGTVVPLTMSKVYARFATGEPQNSFLRMVARTAMAALLTGRGQPRALLDGLGRAARERRLLIYSADRDEERDLLATPVGGTVPDTAGPFAFVVVNNLAGNKMDYYLQRAVSYLVGRCTGGERTSRITVRFGNSAPPADRLPDYVVQRDDTAAGTRDQSVARGSVAVLVSVYGPRGAGIVRSTVDGIRLPVTSYLVAGRPVWGFPLVVLPGRSRSVVLDLVEPVSGAVPVVPVQPLVQPQRVATAVTTCA